MCLNSVSSLAGDPCSGSSCPPRSPWRSADADHLTRSYGLCNNALRQVEWKEAQGEAEESGRKTRPDDKYTAVRYNCVSLIASALFEWKILPLEMNNQIVQW